MKIIHGPYLCLFIVLSSLANPLHFQRALQKPAVKQAEEVFAKWIEWQKIMPDAHVSDLSNHVHEPRFVASLKTAYEKNAAILAPLTPFLETLSAGSINHYGYILPSPLDDTFATNMKNFYHSLDRGVESFLEFLTTAHFLDTKNTYLEDRIDNTHRTIEKYQALFQVLFPTTDDIEYQRSLFSISNRFFEYCFCPPTSHTFKHLLLDPSSRPLVRMMYATMWFNLAGEGWKNWHEESLKTLKEHANNNKNIVYIAGGSDIYQLIKSGIYNLTLIDPQLPSQPKYYTNEWEFILYGNLGDKIIFKLEGDTITMERAECHFPGTKFKARIATGEIIELPHSKTIWKLSNSEGKTLGHYVFLRRFCSQDDFNYDPQKTILMSFNELYFITLPEQFNGWNIDISKIKNDVPFVIKQLRNPINKEVLANIHVASLLNTTDLKFIALGSCIN